MEMLGGENLSDSCLEQAREAVKLEKVMAALLDDAVNCVLEHLASINGIPLEAFLNRLCLVSPIETLENDSVENHCNRLLDKIECTTTFDRRTNYIDKIGYIHRLCQMASTKSISDRFTPWVRENSRRLNSVLASCLLLECQELAQECCFNMTFLARKMHFSMREGAEILIDSLIRLISRALTPREKILVEYRRAEQMFTQPTSNKGAPDIIHLPPIKHNYPEAYSRLVGIVYYTLADLLFSIPLPELIRFFAFRIFRRRELTRLHLFRILDSVVTNLRWIHAEAKRLAGEIQDISERDEVYCESIWQVMPNTLYVDIAKSHSEVNATDSEYPNIILNMLRSQMTSKGPQMDEKALMKVQNYWMQVRFLEVTTDRVPRLSLNLPSLVKEATAVVATIPKILEPPNSRSTASSFEPTATKAS